METFWAEERSLGLSKAIEGPGESAEGDYDERTRPATEAVGPIAK
jgi:hypothetical protein